MNAVDLASGELQIGFIGTYGNRAANMILQECDLVIAVGARLGLRQVGPEPARFAPHAKLIRTDIDQYEISRDIKDDEEKYLMDAKLFMEQLMAEPVPKYSDWQKRCRRVAAALEGFDVWPGNTAVSQISDLLPPDPIVAVDVGQNQCWCAQSLHLKNREGRILIAGGYGSMGCALPFAIGASIFCKKGAVYCITGDGGLQMNIQELETVRREQLPVKILVLNNRVLGKISEIQTVSYGRRYAQTTRESGYTVPDFTMVAQAYGIRATALDTVQQLEKYVGWLKDEAPCLIDIPLPEESILGPKIEWERGNILPPLEPKTEKSIRDLLRENV